MEGNINLAAGKVQFEKARRQANFEQLAARLTGQDTHSLPFEAIRSELRHRARQAGRRFPILVRSSFNLI